MRCISTSSGATRDRTPGRCRLYFSGRLPRVFVATRRPYTPCWPPISLSMTPITSPGYGTSILRRPSAPCKPRFFLGPAVGLQTAMFSDIASAEACVVCNKSEPDSPKIERRLDDIMGANSWSYTESYFSMAEALAQGLALRQAIREAYEHYLAKSATFADPPAYRRPMAV